MATAGLLRYKSGMGHSLIRDPLPAAVSAVDPGNGSVSFDLPNLCRAMETVFPTSKHSPVEER